MVAFLESVLSGLDCLDCLAEKGGNPKVSGRAVSTSVDVNSKHETVWTKLVIRALAKIIHVSADAAAASSTMTFVGVIKSICATALQPKTIDVLRSIAATRCIMGSFTGSQWGVRDFTRFIRMVALFVVAANVLLLHGYQNTLLPLASILFFVTVFIEILTMGKDDPHSNACSCKNLSAAIVGCVMAGCLVLTSFVLSATSESGHVVKAIANAAAVWLEITLIFTMVMNDGNESRDDRGELPDGIHQGCSAMV